MCGQFRHFESPHVLFCTLPCLPYLAMVLGLSELYCSLAKEHPWAEHLTSLPKIGWGGHSFECSALNQERVPCLQ